MSRSTELEFNPNGIPPQVAFVSPDKVKNYLPSNGQNGSHAQESNELGVLRLLSLPISLAKPFIDFLKTKLDRLVNRPDREEDFGPYAMDKMIMASSNGRHPGDKKLGKN